MDILALLILAAMVLFILWGLAKLAIFIIVCAIIYLCVVALIDYLKKAFWT